MKVELLRNSLIMIMKIKAPKALKTIGFITAAIALSKILGFIREGIFAWQYGASHITDSYVVSSQLPLVFFDFLFGEAILSSFIPVFNDILHKENKKRAFEFANTYFNLIFLITATITIIVIVFLNQSVGLYAHGMSYTSLAQHLLYIMFPTMIFTGLAYVCVGILQSLDEFNVPAMISVVSNLIVIIYLIFFNKYGGIFGLAWAIFIGWAMQFIIQIPSLIKKGYRWRPYLKIRGNHFRTVVIMAIPILLSSWVQPICTTINTNVASYFPEGTISSLQYANKIYVLATGIFGFAITSYIFPNMSKLVTKGQWSEYDKMVKTALKWIVIIMAFITLCVMGLCGLAIKFHVHFGNLTADNMRNVATALFFYSFGMIALGVNEVMNKSIFARKKTRISMYASMTGILANVGMLSIFRAFGALSIATLALSVAIGSICDMVFLLIWGRRKDLTERN